MHIFYTPDIQEERYVLSEAESKHCVRVLRLNVGDNIVLVDGQGGFYNAQIVNADSKRCEVELTETRKNFGQRNFRIHLAIAPTKNSDRIEWFLEKATEIGIDRVTPIVCRYSERKNIKHERMEKVAIAAMKQSLKAYLPRLDEIISFNDFIKQSFDGQKFIAHCDEGKKLILKDVVQPGQNYLILIGPEGDFSSKEIQLAIDMGFVPVSLGESRLRTETAGVVACHTFHLVNG